MRECCDRAAYGAIFGEKDAWRALRRYREKGLDETTRRLVDVIASTGIAGATVLEVGGGIGTIVVELMSRGAATGIGVELVPSYEAAANELIEERGLAGRVDRRVLDFAQQASEVASADIVVLNRVICCYPDAPALVGAAATHADRILALTFPADRWYTRIAVRLGNAFLAMRGNGFRGFVHPPALIDRIARNGGLRTIHERIGIIWQTAIYERRGETGD